MQSPCMKRLARERERLPKESSEYFISFKDDNMRSFEAYIVGPEDSQYQHKFVKLKFDIPNDYPFKPPKVKFIQHTGDRIHPNLYTEGKVCLSILGTWPGEPWTFSMNIESILITIRSLLDSKPYLHEPNKKDDPNFNRYVQYNTWKWLLLDYLDREQDPAMRDFLQHYLHKHGKKMIAELEKQRNEGGASAGMSSPYNGGGQQRRPDYDSLLAELRKRVSQTARAFDSLPSPESDMEDAKSKRKAPCDQQHDQPPKQKAKIAADIIDLTDDP